MIQRFALLIEYNGAHFNGWQKQPNLKTVQGTIETALQSILKSGTNLVGAGRTDSGVHARGQTAHFDAILPQDPSEFKARLNHILGKDYYIYIHDLKPVNTKFHARYSALKRQYIYSICTRYSVLNHHVTWYYKPNFDYQVLQEISQCLVGDHDFKSFSKQTSKNPNTHCLVDKAEWIQTAEHEFKFVIRANRFLHNMVRMLTGTLLKYASGHFDREDFNLLLSNQPTAAIPHKAPAKGLVLESVLYDQPVFG